MKRGMGSPNFDKAKQREIASQGGKRAHALHRAHEWTPEAARVAGRKGGRARRKAEAA
jgi:general stress protein YciG